MRYDLLGALRRAPWWVLSLVSGTVFALGQLAFHLLAGTSPTASVITAALMGVVFGAVMGPFTRRTNLRYQAAMGDLPAAQERIARRAAMRGPAPQDPEVRRAALGAIALQLEMQRKTRWATVFWLLMIALSTWLTVVDSPWWLLTVGLFGGFLLLQLWTPGHLRKRQRLLDDSLDASSA